MKSTSIYKTDGRVQPGIGPPSSAIPKRLNLGPQFIKRKARSVCSTSSNPSLLSVSLSSETDKSNVQEKKTSPAIIPRQRNFKKLVNNSALAKNTKNNNDDIIENKRLEFLTFQKQFIAQQRTYIELYAQLRDLEDHSGVPAGTTVGEVRLLSVAGWPVHELLLLMSGNAAAPTQHKPEVKGVLGPKILQQLNTQLKGILLSLGNELLSRRTRLIEFIRENQRKFVSNSNIQQWHIKNVEFDEETKQLRRLVSETAKTFESKILNGLDIAKVKEVTILMEDAQSREAQLKSRVDEEIQIRQSLEAQIQELEKNLRNMQEKYSVLQECSRELVVLQQQKCLEYLPQKGECVIEDIGIWNDLQATKGALGRVTEELEHCRADRDSLLKSLASVAHEGGENKMAEELLNREHTIWRLQNNVEELKRDKAKLEQNLTCYKNQLTTLRFEVSHLRSFDSYRSDSEKIPNEELEREIYNLYLQVDTLKRERAELASEATMRALLLERHERCAQMFAQVTRARHELAAQIAGSTPTMDGPDIQEVSPSLSKAYLSSADNWSALRAERARVLRLERTVYYQRQQLERESLVRVQHEQRRASLERELIRIWANNLQRSSEAQAAEFLLFSNSKNSKLSKS